jgi:hypothetical protein
VKYIVTTSLKIAPVTRKSFFSDPVSFFSSPTLQALQYLPREIIKRLLDFFMTVGDLTNDLYWISIICILARFAVIAKVDLSTKPILRLSSPAWRLLGLLLPSCIEILNVNTTQADADALLPALIESGRIKSLRKLKIRSSIISESTWKQFRKSADHLATLDICQLSIPRATQSIYKYFSPLEVLYIGAQTRSGVEFFKPDAYAPSVSLEGLKSNSSYSN